MKLNSRGFLSVNFTKLILFEWKFQYLFPSVGL